MPGIKRKHSEHNNNNPNPDIFSTNEKLLRDMIVELATKRGIEKTCWPAEIPRILEKKGALQNWRDYLSLTREVCVSLAKEGIIVIEQKKKRLGW